VAASVVHALMDFLGDSNNPSALDVVAFVRYLASFNLDKRLQLIPIVSEVVEKFPPLRQSICSKLITILSSIKSAKVFRGVFWILGEYTEELPEISSTFQEIRKIIGEIPILASEQRAADEAVPGAEEANGDKPDSKPEGGRPRVLADGTYATESAYTATKADPSSKTTSKPPLRGKVPNPLGRTRADVPFQP
jgi:coatomer subunit beta